MLTAFAEGHEGEINPLLPTLPDLLWGTLAFLIILALFIWKILPNLNKMLDARSEAIEGSINSAEAAQAEAQAALEKYTAQLADARAEAGRIRETAREDGKRIVAEAREQASTEAARVTAGAQAQIEAERQSALVSLRSEVGTIAIDLASGVVGESLSDDAKAKAVVDRFLADLEASEQAAAGGKK
jgi:F-type H+-transporting ATPase subunit b